MNPGQACCHVCCRACSLQ